MKSLAELVRQEFITAIDKRLPDSSIHVGKRLQLPGFYRATKQWDILVVDDCSSPKRVLAAVELKMMAAAYGKNMNNRAEEAIGNAVELRTAYQGGMLGDTKPWLGWVFFVRDEKKSSDAIKRVPSPHFPIDSDFKDKCYKERAQELCKRLVGDGGDGLYDQAWFLTADTSAAHRAVDEPDPDMTWAKFQASIKSRMDEVLDATPTTP